MFVAVGFGIACGSGGACTMRPDSRRAMDFVCGQQCSSSKNQTVVTDSGVPLAWQGLDVGGNFGENPPPLNFDGAKCPSPCAQNDEIAGQARNDTSSARNAGWTRRVTATARRVWFPLVPPRGIEPRPDDYKSTARPSCYGGRVDDCNYLIRTRCGCRLVVSEDLKGTNDCSGRASWGLLLLSSSSSDGATGKDIPWPFSRA